MDGSWQLLFSPEGSFLEGFQGDEIANCGGYDGEKHAWDIDTAGRVSLLDLDDREVSNEVPVLAECLEEWVVSELVHDTAECVSLLDLDCREGSNRY